MGNNKKKVKGKVSAAASLARGFQTTSEAIYCGKKLLVIPIRGQYEQECNVISLKNLGVMCGDLNSISSFLFNDLVISKKWTDPTDKIIGNILNGDKKL
jgi:hypothetical protein